MWKDRDRIVNQPILNSLISLALPAVGSSLFYIIFEIVDMFWVGRLGAQPVAALSAASFFVWMLRALAQTVATGTIALISRRVGENDEKRFIRTVTNAIVTACFFSIFVILVLTPVTTRIYHWIRLEPDVAVLSGGYARVFLSGLLFIYLMVTCEHILRGTGNTKIPMMITGFSLMLNVILDPLFIFHFKMGLEGAAYATVIAQIIGCCMMLAAVIMRFPPVRKFRLEHLRGFFKEYFFPIIRIGAPVSISGVAFAGIYLMLAGIVSAFGSIPLAAMGIGHRIEAFPYFIALGFSMAAATMVGQNLGAGNPAKAKASASLSLAAASGILFVLSIVFYFFPRQLYHFFINDSEVMKHGITYLRIIAVFEVFLAAEVVLEGVFSGAGDTKPPFLIIFPITLLRVPLSYVFGITFGWGVIAIWVVISVTTFLKGLLLVILFERGKWMRRQV